MPYVDPGAVTTGTTITSTWGNAVRNAEQYLANPPACRVFHNAAQAVTATVETSLAFNSERYDTDTMHDTVTNNSRITIKTAGLYLITATVQFAADTDYIYSYALIRWNGGTQLAYQGIGTLSTSAITPLICVSTVYKFAVNDYVEVRVGQNNTSGNANNVLASGNGSPEFTANWIGLG